MGSQDGIAACLSDDNVGHPVQSKGQLHSHYLFFSCCSCSFPVLKPYNRGGVNGCLQWVSVSKHTYFDTLFHLSDVQTNIFAIACAHMLGSGCFFACSPKITPWQNHFKTTKFLQCTVQPLGCVHVRFSPLRTDVCIDQADFLHADLK